MGGVGGINHGTVGSSFEIERGQKSSDRVDIVEVGMSVS